MHGLNPIVLVSSCHMYINFTCLAHDHIVLESSPTNNKLYLYSSSHNIIQIHNNVLWDLTLFHGIFSMFNLIVRNIMHNTVNPTQHCYNSE